MPPAFAAPPAKAQPQASKEAIMSGHGAPASAARLARLRRPPTAGPRIAWRYAVPIVVIHALTLLALLPSLFSWTGVVLLVTGVYFYGSVGINLCYHRLLTHRSFRVPLWLERGFLLVALCCMEDAPATWVATHRRHHIDADEEPDPHSPLVSFFWSHVGWLLIENRAVRSASAYDRFARDVLKDPFCMWLQRSLTPVWIYMAHAVLYFAAGVGAGLWLWGTLPAALQFGASVVVWGVLLRTVAVWHISWSVNSLSHLFGYRSYETGENSRNNWLVALLSSGEGWHNNHHIDQASASNWHRWWEIDPIYMVIRGLELVGLATDVIRPRHERRPSSSADELRAMTAADSPSTPLMPPPASVQL